MSYSSLWTINNQITGSKEVEFENSWLFSPIALNILFNKYMPWKKVNTFKKRTNYIVETMFDNELAKELNKLINGCGTIEDRILWELCNQQVFFTKDKEFISKCIIKFIANFLQVNDEFTEDCQKHIFNRFKDIAKSIKNIDIDKKPYFVFKNSNCDNTIEYWFSGYDKEEGKYFKKSLLDLKMHVTEFVVIKNKRISKFISNINFKI